MGRCVARVVLPFMIGALTAAASARAAIPGADNPKAVTEHTFRAALLDFNLRMSVERYKQVGKRDPKWDEPAAAFLEAMARYFANLKVATRYKVQPAPTLTELIKQGRAVVDLGCDDPLVIYDLAVALDNNLKYEDARPLFKKVLNDIPSSRYPVIRLSGVANRMLMDFDRAKVREGVEYERCEQTLIDGILASISVAEFRGMDRRAILGSVEEYLEPRPLDVWKRVCADAHAVNADPWLLNMLEGLYHVKAGWVARGGGYAFKVTPEGWRGFADHLKAARKCFEKAYALEPTYPEAASEMIAVAMAGHAGDDEDERFWFERAVTAQLDYEPAYTKYLWSIWPRWDGSHDEMFAFGLECAATKRYDTGVPYVLIEAIEAIIRDTGGNSAAAWRHEGVYPAAAEVLTAYADRPEEAPRKTWLTSYHVSIAIYARHYKDADALMKQIKHKLVWNAVDRTRALPGRLFYEVAAMVGPHSAGLRDGELQVDEGAFDDAIKAYDHAIANVPPHFTTLRYLRGRAAELRWLKQYHAGEPVDIQPDKDLNGWYANGGKWSVDQQGRLVGAGEASGLNLICGAEFGSRYEITGRMEYVNVGKIKEPAAGPIVTYSRSADSYGLWMRKGSQRVVMRNPDGKAKAWPAKVGDNNEFRVAVWNGHVFGWVNGELAFDDYQVPRMNDAGLNRIGVGAQFNFRPESIEVRFSDLKIRKLDAPPFKREIKEVEELPPPPSREGDL